MEIEDYEREIRRQKKWKNFYFVVAILALLALLGVNYFYSDQVDSQNSAYTSLQNQFNSLQGHYNFLSSSYQYQRGQINVLNQEMNNVLRYYDQNRVVYQTPGANTSIQIWTRTAIVEPGSWTSWALLDTFVNHIQITSNATAEFIIVDLPNYVNLAQNRAYVPIAENSSTSFSYTARISQGCSGYILVIYDHSSHPILVTPNVTATYAPTPFLTGQCTLP
jgi:Tfp pilus assembly protein PilV